MLYCLVARCQIPKSLHYVVISVEQSLVKRSLMQAIQWWEALPSEIINPRRACAARVTVVVLCLCVCLFVYYYSRTTGYEAAYERYQQIQCYKGRKNNVAILLKRLHSRDMA